MDKHISTAANNDSAAEGAQTKAIQEALSIYHVCKDGSVVTNPKDCIQHNNFPNLILSEKA